MTGCRIVQWSVRAHLHHALIKCRNALLRDTGRVWHSSVWYSSDMFSQCTCVLWQYKQAAYVLGILCQTCEGPVWMHCSQYLAGCFYLSVRASNQAKRQKVYYKWQTDFFISLLVCMSGITYVRYLQVSAFTPASSHTHLPPIFVKEILVPWTQYCSNSLTVLQHKLSWRSKQFFLSIWLVFQNKKFQTGGSRMSHVRVSA